METLRGDGVSQLASSTELILMTFFVGGVHESLSREFHFRPYRFCEAHIIVT
jgi:hypothetical protein